MDFYQKKGKLWVSEGTHIYGEIPTPPRQDVLRGIIHDFPDRITCEEADKRLTDGMNLVGVPPYDKRKDRTTVYEIRKEEGLDVGRKFWTRAATVTPPSSSHITAKVTPVSPGPRRSK